MSTVRGIRTGLNVHQQQQQHQGGGNAPAGSQSTADSTSNYFVKEKSQAYSTGKLLGNGSFGIVFEAIRSETGEQVAIKKVLQDPRYKNRELDILKELKHPNIVELRDYFYTEGISKSTQTTPATAGPAAGGPAAAAAGGNPQDQQQPQRFLNVVMEFLPETVYKVMKSFIKTHQSLPSILVRLYTYQLCRSLGYLHSLGVCHRDIKPQNLLVDPRTHILKLCDFGSAKHLLPSEHSVAYICSRFYRAPELMLGATEYTSAIDIWSAGCVLGELLLGRPLFAGNTSVDQLVKIIQVLGTPTRKQMQAMNPNYTEFQFPDVQARDWRTVLGDSPPSSLYDDELIEEAVDLLSSLLRYEPLERIQPFDALAHRFFDPLRDADCVLPDCILLPDLFNFSESELRCMSTAVRAIVIPTWTNRSNRSIESLD